MRLIPVAAILLAACAPRPTDGPAADRPAAPAPGPLTGAWQTEGYGLALVATGDSIHAFEITRTTCVPSFTATRDSAAPAAGILAAYQTQGRVFKVLPGPDPTSRRLHADGAASDMIIRAIPARPAVCDAPTPDTPAGNFEVFAQTWAEHYILFDQKKADWPATVAAARARVTATTTPAELFDILSGMIAPFEDAHTSIQATTIDKRFQALRRGTDRLVKGGFATFVSDEVPKIFAVTNRQLRGELRHFCNDQLQYGHVDDSTGYLRIVSESGYAKGGFAEGLVALEAALDTIFSDPKLKGLVLDVRINFGGADPYGLALASRLATGEWVAYSKEARLDPVDRTRWTPGQPSRVVPSTRPGFKGPVVELIGPLTISAGETTTQALMGRIPRVLRIGENTQGVFSDVLGRRMPNGWRFGLPNEVFRAADGSTFDGPGIPPDILVPVFAEQDLRAGRDPALARALAELHVQR